MSIVAIGLNLLLAGLLSAALWMGHRLNVRLKALRDSHEGFAKAVAELDAAAARAEQGLADLRAATDEATDALADRIEKARALTTKLDRLTQERPAAASVQPAGRPRPVREALDLDADVERVTHRLGSLLSGAREPRPRQEPERFVRRDPPPARQRPRFEDELFAEDDEFESRPTLRAAVGGRR